MNLLIIIPCYNEENRLPKKEFIDFFENNHSKIHFLMVNDGSSDATIDILNCFKSNYQNIEVIDLKENVGKAEAVRHAILHSKNTNFDYIGYFDADLATPLNEIDKFIEQIILKNPLFLLGSRVKLLGLTQIERKWYRHYFGRVFATIASKMLKIPVYDTQCGAKMLKREVIDELFKEKFISSWLFDLELLFRLKVSPLYKKNETPIIEIPLTKWEEKGESKIPFSYLFKIPFELFRIYLRYK